VVVRFLFRVSILRQLSFFGAGFLDYKEGVSKDCYYPAERDGRDAPFNSKIKSAVRSLSLPMAIMIRHHEFIGICFFSGVLAKMGIISVLRRQQITVLPEM